MDYTALNSDNSNELVIKVLLLGDNGVGKSSILDRFVDDIYNDNTNPTKNVNLKQKIFDLDNKKIKMEISEISGLESQKDAMENYCNETNGILLIYDVTNANSFENLNNYLTLINEKGKENIIKILVGNKTDLEDKREITFYEGKEFADNNGFQFLETSAKNNFNIDNVFEIIGKKITEKNKNEESNKSEENNKIESVQESNSDNKNKCCCCLF